MEDTGMDAMQSRAALAEARRTVTIVNERGLHARASAKFVATAQNFESSVFVRRGSELVDASSIMDLLMLAAGPGTDVEIEARGADAEAAVVTLAALVAGRFGEER